MKREFFILCLAVLFSGFSRADSVPAPVKQLVSQENLIGDTQRKLLPSTPSVLSPLPEQKSANGYFCQRVPLLGDRLCRNGDGASKPYFFRTVGARCPRALYGGARVGEIAQEAAK